MLVWCEIKYKKNDGTHHLVVFQMFYMIDPYDGCDGFGKRMEQWKVHACDCIS